MLNFQFGEETIKEFIKVIDIQNIIHDNNITLIRIENNKKDSFHYLYYSFDIQNIIHDNNITLIINENNKKDSFQ